MRPMALPRAAVLVAALAALSPSVVAASHPGSPLEQALAACATDAPGPPAQRLAALDRALAIAESALAGADDDPAAHFAVFCTLGRRAEVAGAGLGSLFTLRRLRREIDRTLALAPDWPDALAAKAAMLLRLPGWLGGDAEEASELARRALARAPDLKAARDALVAARAALPGPQRAPAAAGAPQAAASAAEGGDDDGALPAAVAPEAGSDAATALLARLERGRAAERDSTHALGVGSALP